MRRERVHMVWTGRGPGGARPGGSDGVSDEPQDRGFERWALAGAGVLAIAGIAAFLVRREPPAATGGDDGADVLRVRIGGQRQPADASGSAAARVAPDPGPHDARRDREPSATGHEGHAASMTGNGDGVATPEMPATPRTIVVQPGETLGQIAQRELGTVKRLPEILALNGIDDPDSIRAGTELALPPR